MNPLSLAVVSIGPLAFTLMAQTCPQVDHQEEVAD
jgi:hypothetical protein